MASRKKERPSFLTKPTDVTVSEGCSIVLECEVTEVDSVVWYKDGIIQMNSADCKQTFDGKKATLEIRQVFLGASGTYACSISNSIAECRCSCNVILTGTWATDIPPSKEKTNYFRLAGLLIDVGKLALKTQFDSVFPPKTLSRDLKAPPTYQLLNNLLHPKRILVQAQFDLMFPDLKVPPSSKKVDSSDFDVTLLSCLIRNLPAFKVATSAVWTDPCPPSASDHSLAADVKRLRILRNEIAHSSIATMEDHHFNDKWQEASNAIIRLCKNDNAIQVLLKDLLQKTIDPEMEKKCQNELQKMKDIDHELKELQVEVTELREDVRSNREDINKNANATEKLSDDFEREIKKKAEIQKSKPHINMIQQNVQVRDVVFGDNTKLKSKSLITTEETEKEAPEWNPRAEDDSNQINFERREMLPPSQEYAKDKANSELTTRECTLQRSYANVTKNVIANKATIITANEATVVTCSHVKQGIDRMNTHAPYRTELQIKDFLNAVHDFKSVSFVLITDHINPTVDAQHIGLVPWSLVFDFDPASRSDGLLCQAEKSSEERRSLQIMTYQDECMITDESMHWIFMKGMTEQPDTKTDDAFSKWKKQTRSGLEAILRQIEKSGYYTNYCVIVLWPSNQNLTFHVKHLVTKLEELGLCELVIIYEEFERSFDDMKQEYEKEPTFICMSFKDVCRAIQHIFVQEGVNKSSNYAVPVLTSNPVDIDDQIAQWLKEELEVLYLKSPYDFKLSVDNLIEESDNFLRGGNWPWYMRYSTDQGQGDAERDIMVEIIAYLRGHHINIFKSGRVTIFHAPGSGGTTLAQRILWELHTLTPCLQVKLRTGSSDVTRVSKRIELLYDKTRSPILILLDGEDEQRMDMLMKDLSQICCVVLYVKRDPMEENRNSKGVFRLQRYVSQQEAIKIADRFLNRCNTPGKQGSIKKLCQEVQQRKSHEIFEFGLATYGHQYVGIESYVKGFLQLGSAADNELLPWQHALGILSLVYFYAHMPMPCKFFSKLFGHSSLLTIVDFPDQMSALIVKDRNEGRNNVIRISHHLVAKEIIEQILSRPFHREGERGEDLCVTAKLKLGSFALNFIKFAAENVLGKSTDIMKNIMTHTFIFRGNKAAEEQFSRILLDVTSRAPYTERFDILEELVNTFPNEPQFVAHLGRLYSLCRPEKEAAGEQCFKIAVEIGEKEISDIPLDKIPRGKKLTLMHIYHMYGSMLLKRVSEYTGKTFGDRRRRQDVSEETFDEILGNLFGMVQNACDYFTKCRDMTPPGLELDHGFVGEITIRLMLCDFVCRQYTKGDLYKFIKQYETNFRVADFVEDSINVIDDLILECFSVVDPDKIGRQLQECQKWFLILFKTRTRSGVMFRTQDTIKTRRLDIAATKLQYEKKQIYGVLEVITNRSDIEFIVKSYEANFIDIHENGKHCSRKELDLDYKEWIFAIRHKQLSIEYLIEDVLRQVRLWHQKVNTPNSLFYLFVLCSLLGFGACANGGNTELLLEAQQHKEDLLKKSKYINKPRYPREWLGTGLGIHRLTPGIRFFGLIDGREIKGSFNSESVQTRTGTICKPNDKPASGYIRLFLGNKNLVDINVFYVPGVSDMKGPAFANSDVEFFVGFSMAHGYEAYNVRPLKRIKCKECGLFSRVRSTKCECGANLK